MGIELRVVGDKLKVKADVGVITDEIKADLVSHKSEIMEVLQKPIRSYNVYRVVIETDGVQKAMTVIDPSGDVFSTFQDSCKRRFGANRVVSVEQHG